LYRLFDKYMYQPRLMNLSVRGEHQCWALMLSINAEHWCSWRFLDEIEHNQYRWKLFIIWRSLHCFDLLLEPAPPKPEIRLSILLD
jgi:hypothetical protein